MPGEGGGARAQRLRMAHVSWTVVHSWGEGVDEGTEMCTCLQGNGARGQGHKRPDMPLEDVHAQVARSS